ncbi:MAG TPA: hypothetical protein VLC79_06620 [Cellvibrio sp.]|nr:hypothetical protein [Cellvibrio sp.]
MAESEARKGLLGILLVFVIGGIGFSLVLKNDNKIQTVSAEVSASKEMCVNNGCTEEVSFGASQAYRVSVPTGTNLQKGEVILLHKECRPRIARINMCQYTYIGRKT